jgi:hypothetical protein
VRVPHGQNRRPIDPDTKLILEELRDLRLEMRADRQQAAVDRQQASAERRRADEALRQERRQADEALRQERRQADEALRQERLRSDERFAQVMRGFQEDSARREAATRKAFRDIRIVGLSIVKTLNRHTRLLERIDRKLGARGNGRPGHEDGRGA